MVERTIKLDLANVIKGAVMICLAVGTFYITQTASTAANEKVTTHDKEPSSHLISMNAHDDDELAHEKMRIRQETFWTEQTEKIMVKLNSIEARLP